MCGYVRSLNLSAVKLSKLYVIGLCAFSSIVKSRISELMGLRSNYVFGDLLIVML